MKTFQRILAIALALIMSLSVLGMVASAASVIDQTTGSITIHKYELNGTAGNPAPGTALEDSQLPEGATPLAEVTFTAYQVVNADTLKAYYDGTANAETDAKIAAAIANPSSLCTEANGTYTVKDINDTTVSATGTDTTEADGLAEFTDLPLGLYLIIETEAPDKVVTAQAPFLVSLPMTVDNEWLYDIHVYPKNSTSEGNVSLVKKDDNDNLLAGVTFKLEKQEGTSWTVVGQDQTTNASGTITWSSLTHGEYRVTEISAPEGYIVDPNPIAFTVKTDNTIECTDTRALLTVDEFNTASKTLTLTLVNEKPTFDKEITANENVAGVGETVSYSLTTTVPQNIGEMNTYTVTDAPKGLSVVDTTEKPITVTVADVGVLAENTNYTKTINSDGGFTLTFKPATMTACAGKTMTITYDATVTTDAVDATTDKTANEAPNTATLIYTDKLGTDSTYEIDDDEVTKLYKATITKKLDSEEGTVAEDVKFMAYDKADLTTALKFTKESDGSYTLDPNGDVTELVTDANGEIVINGLGKHTYYLVETETKAGYNLLSGAVELNVGGESDYEFETTVINKKGFTLPQTGGIGTLMFFIIGGVLIAGGICLITVPNKKRSV